MLFLLSPRVLWIYSVTGEWVYPLFASFSPAGLGAFFISSLAIVVCFYNFGEFLNRMIWGQSNFCFYFYPCEKKKNISYDHQGRWGEGHSYTGAGGDIWIEIAKS